MSILPRYGSCVLDHRYFLGTFSDFLTFAMMSVLSYTVHDMSLRVYLLRVMSLCETLRPKF